MIFSIFAVLVGTLLYFATHLWLERVALRVRRGV